MGNKTSYSEEFKKQIVMLYKNGKSVINIGQEYNLPKPTIYSWVKNYNNSGSFKAKDNRTLEENEIITLRKELKDLKMENDIFKASRTDNGQKITIINNNKTKYSVRKICKILGLSKSTYYYQTNKCINKQVNNYEQEIISAFNKSRKIYGARKIKVILNRKDIILSRRKIRFFMIKNNLVSKYTKLKYHNHKTTVNNDQINNILNRQFNNKKPNEVIVSDLTYVQVGAKWHYICLLIDLFNREIIGYSAGPNKTVELVQQAFHKITRPLNQITLFHTDRGNEFKNKIIDEILITFNIKRSLSNKGCPYDNAVAETTYKTFKTEFIKGKKFKNLTQLKYELFDFVHWYNNIRIHGILNYLSPVTFRKQMSI
ncbi:IS3 family transposase [Spiroplasma endosymbiont of Poecilobothrus nobilitatus]|uniref:IS3 family transposase n=1 Tax=Spiroplasma endosymbiont of Poecilobothrus nobilitatus TaxID=1209220 RepID=UPI00313DE0DB